MAEIATLVADVADAGAALRWFAVKLFERDSKVQARFTLGKDVQDKIEKLITAVEEELDDDAESIITDARYQYIGKLVKDCVKKKKTGLSTSDKIDHIVTNRILALPIFALIMWLVYYVSVSTAGGIFTDWANDGVFGEGWHLFTIGAADYEEATAEYDDQITRRDAWLEAADEAGIDTSALTEALEAEEADETAIADAAAAIEADPAAASVVGTAEFEDEDSGKVTTENVDLATFEETLTAAEPDPADFGVWVPGIPVLLEKLFASMGVNEDGWVYSLVMDGIVAGVGAVLGFVPQMLILFFFLAILEDCGYMARVAFIMDRIFRKFGLSGKSFIPMLIGSGCGVPAVMASRTIEQERDRRMTIMTTCFIPCGAKLPIIAMFAGAVLWRLRHHRILRIRSGRAVHHHLGHHAQEVQDLHRRPGSVRHGAAELPRSDRRQRIPLHVGARLLLHQEGRHRYPAVHHLHVVHPRLRLGRRHVLRSIRY